MRRVVDQNVFGRDLWILLRDFLEGVLQQSFGELEDVRLSGAVDCLSSLGDRVAESEPDDFLAALARDQLQTLGNARRLHVLDAGVEILDIFTNDDNVERATGEGSLHAGQLAYGSNVAVGLEQCAQGYVRAAVTVTDRGLERTLQNDFRSFDGLNRLPGNAGRNAFLENASSGFTLLEFEGNAGRVYDGKG